MHCEFYTQDWMVVTSTLAFMLGVVAMSACAYIQQDDGGIDKAVTRHDEDIRRLSLNLDKMRSQYESEMLTILRETLRPPSHRSDTTNDPPLDNNSIPAGPSGPLQ